MRKALFVTFGLVCLVLGLLTVWTPLPTGIPLIALSMVILVGASRTARRLVRGARDRFDWFHYGVAFVEERANRNMATRLKRTRPLRRPMLAPVRHAVAATVRTSRRDTPPIT